MNQGSVPRLITGEFVALCALMFVTYCNLSVFFEFHLYLEALPLPRGWLGFLIGIFSMTILVLRPIISPFLNDANAKKWILISSCLVTVALLFYGAADGLWSMALLRIFHGAAYVVLATAVLARVVSKIPVERSGEAFGLLSVLTLLPYAAIPPILDPLTSLLGGFPRVLALMGVFMLSAFPLMSFVKDEAHGKMRPPEPPIRWDDLKENLSDLHIWVVLLLGLLVWTTFTPVFFFLKGFGDKINIPNAGLFFSLSTVMEISVRVVAGRMFDKVDKTLLLAGSLAWLAAGFFLLAQVRGEILFYGMGIFLGLGWGVAMPVLSGLTFDLSQPRFRALNTNLSMEMFQGGYFVGPLGGAYLLSHWDYEGLFFSCACIMILGFAGALVVYTRRGRRA